MAREHLAGDVVGRAGAGGGIVDLPGRGLRPWRSAPPRCGRRARDAPPARGRAMLMAATVHQVAHQHKGALRQQRLVRPYGCSTSAAGCGRPASLSRRLGADDATGAGPVVDHHRLAERLARAARRHEACSEIRRAARPKGTMMRTGRLGQGAWGAGQARQREHDREGKAVPGDACGGGSFCLQRCSAEGAGRPLPGSDDSHRQVRQPGDLAEQHVAPHHRADVLRRAE